MEHVIETTSSPVSNKARRPCSKKLKAAKEFEYTMQQDLYRSSKSPWVSSLHLVQKKNNDWCLCGDYRKLNEVTLLVTQFCSCKSSHISYMAKPCSLR